MTQIIDYMGKHIALDVRRFKSRLIFKAVSEIFKKELSKVGISSSTIDEVKENMIGVTQNLVHHSANCSELVAKHASNVLHDGMTILVHSYSRSTMAVLRQA
jgi:translation initiation factor 2B subunit (eIF-2B alpha/beta/delta family)